MAKKNRAKNQLQKDYTRERNRILRRIRNYENQGLIVDLNVPEPPQRITQGSVRRLKKITLQKIRQSTKAPDLETGEVTTYARYARQKREQRKRKLKKEQYEPFAPTGYEQQQTQQMPSYADIVITTFKGGMTIYNQAAQEIINLWLNNLLSRYSAEEVADMLQKAAESGVTPDYSVVYNQDALYQRLGDMLDFMDLPPGRKQDLIDALEFDETFESY